VDHVPWIIPFFFYSGASFIAILSAIGFCTIPIAVLFSFFITIAWLYLELINLLGKIRKVRTLLPIKPELKKQEPALYQFGTDPAPKTEVPIIRPGLWEHPLYSSRAFFIDERKLKASYDRSSHSKVNPKIKRLGDFWEDQRLKEFLLRHARPSEIAGRLFEKTHQLLSGPCAFILSDRDGRIIKLYASRDIVEECRLKGVQEGASLTESSCGTNAVSLALYHKEAVIIQGTEHFCELFHSWCCVAVPLFGPDGQLAGCVDWSISSTTRLDEKLSLVKKFAEQIQKDAFPLSEA
jgi:hypothetical protein